jgi:hypothetical protein
MPAGLDARRREEQYQADQHQADDSQGGQAENSKPLPFGLTQSFGFDHGSDLLDQVVGIGVCVDSVANKQLLG